MAERDRRDGAQERNTGADLSGILIRLVVASVVLAITAFLTPGFRISGIWALVIGAAVLAIMDYLIAKVAGLEASPFGKGIVGFILAGIIIYATQFFVAGYSVTIWGAVIGALVFGIIDAIIPGRAM